ncbi:hypothetical protein V2G26_004856 [Clonostachys chloroleuca]
MGNFQSAKRRGNAEARKGDRICPSIGNSPILEHLAPIAVWARGRSQQLLFSRRIRRYRRDCQAAILGAEVRYSLWDGDALRLDFNNLTALVPALHGGSIDAPGVYISVGVADSADLEASAGDASVGITSTSWVTAGMCTVGTIGSTGLGGNEA